MLENQFTSKIPSFMYAYISKLYAALQTNNDNTFKKRTPNDIQN